MGRSYTIGTDPELFLFNTKTQKVVSAIDKIPGCKAEPYREGLPEGFGLQTDNILAEFNVPPVTKEDDFVANIEYMKNLIRKMAKEINENFDILCQASAKVPPKELKHPQAKEFGCDPDYCVYTQKKNEVNRVAKTNLRSAGYHLHVGYDNPSIDKSINMLLYVDAYVGLPSILYDTDTERRQLYGKAGCFRLQDWGFEYRVLSSYWIGNESRLRFIWKQLSFALYAYEHDRVLPPLEVVRATIDNNDIETAKKLIADYELIHPYNKNPE